MGASQLSKARVTRKQAERIAGEHYTTLIQLQHDEPKLNLSGDFISVQHLRWALGY